MVVAAMGLASAPTAGADSAPADPNDARTPPTVAIDLLPTAQHDGVAWNQLVVGSTVYVVGKFTTARPSGSAPGQNVTVRNNMLAYDLVTGALKPAFNPNLNAQVYAVAASPDGSRIYIGGDFTTVGGLTRSRIAALDPVTGAMIGSFNARADASVRAIAATATTVYVGGLFTTVNTTTQPRMAALNAVDGSVRTTFRPVFTGAANSTPRVNAMVLSPTGDRLAIGGNFVRLNGSDRPGYGLGMVNATTGASLPLQVNDVVRDAGANAGFVSLASDGTHFYGTGYHFGSGGNFEGAFSANWSDGRMRWMEDCHGDTYGVYPSSTAVYVATHAHYCLNLGGYDEIDPPMRALAFSKASTGLLTPDTRGYTSFTGQPAPSLLNFFPQMATGTFTGQLQAAWTVTGSGGYVVYAGEFLAVNGTAQQGMARFATRDIAPNRQGPKASAAESTPTLTSPAPGSVKVAWTANFDYDNSNLVYTVLRDGLSTPSVTIPRSSVFYSRPAMSFTETGLAAGQHSYRVRAVDPFGNAHTSPAVSITILGVGNNPPSAAFTATVAGSTVTVDGRGSRDPDGAISSYAWAWGDGRTGTGATASHTFAADGNYTITLTVTDNGGAQASASRAVRIGNAPVLLASDSFGRTLTSGFGSADIGGAWSTNGSGFAVNGGQGLVTVAAAGQGPWGQLAGVTSAGTDLVGAIRLDRLVNAGGAYAGIIGRRVGTADYRLKLKVDPAGVVTLYAVRSAGGEATLASTVVAGFTYTAGARLNTRLQVTGTNPTTVRARVWPSTGTEPATWQVNVTDSTAGLQAAGSVGLFTFVSASATNTPWVFRFDDLVARPA